MNDMITRVKTSFPFIEKFPLASGRKINADNPKRRTARVNGGVLSRDHLNIGAASPQIKFAIIKASIAFRVVFIQSLILRRFFTGNLEGKFTLQSPQLNFQEE